MRYIKKPIIIEAVQYDKTNTEEVLSFAEGNACYSPNEGLIIATLEGEMHASDGDYIIKGVNGEFYPCKPDIFAKTYDEYHEKEERNFEPEDNFKGVDFGTALMLMKTGEKMCREGWNGKNIFIALKEPEPGSDMTHSFIYVDSTGVETDNPLAQKIRVPWLPGQADMLAEDWCVYLFGSEEKAVKGIVM